MDKNDQMVEIRDEDTKHEDFPQEVIESTETDWKAKAMELQGIAKRRATQLAKAKEKLATVKPETPPAQPQDKQKKSDDLDYALELKTELAFHNTKSNSLKVETDEEVEFVKNLKQETGKSTGALLNSKYFQAEFKAFKDSKTVDIAANTPDKGRGGNQVPASKSVEYWMNKPDTEWPEDTHENKKLISDIANARYERAKS